MGKILRSPQAAQDLDDIWFYIAQDSVTAADRWLDVLLEKAMTLAEHPLIGHARLELAAELRSLPVKAYMVYYKPVEGGVELVRVLNASRDIDSIFADKL